MQVDQPFQACGRHSREAVELALQLRPDVAVLHVAPAETEGVEAARRIRAECRDTEVVVLSTDHSEQMLRHSLEAGARGVVLKSDASELLLQAVEAASRHEPFFSPRVSALIVEGYLRPAAPPGSERLGGFRLTPREREIVQLVAEGRTSKEVAAGLKVSVKTVEAHRANVMRKLGLHSVAELVRYAVRNRLVGP